LIIDTVLDFLSLQLHVVGLARLRTATRVKLNEVANGTGNFNDFRLTHVLLRVWVLRFPDGLVGSVDAFCVSEAVVVKHVAFTCFLAVALLNIEDFSELVKNVDQAWQYFDAQIGLALEAEAQV